MTVSLNFAIILYFCMAHVFFICFLIFQKDSSFNQKLAECYIWPFFLITSVHNFLSKILVFVFEHVTNVNENIKDVLLTIKSHIIK